MLKKNEVDLEHGVLNIVETKGHDQHYVTVHESMIIIMREYDQRMEELVPERVYFFPGKKDGYRSKESYMDSGYKVINYIIANLPITGKTLCSVSFHRFSSVQPRSGLKEERTDLFRGILAVPGPPADGFGKVIHHVIQHVVIRNGF